MKIDSSVVIFALQQVEKEHKEALPDETIKELVDKKVQELIENDVVEPVLMLKPEYKTWGLV